MRAGPIISSRKSFGSLPEFGGQFRHHGLHGERVRNVVDRAEPADAGLGDGFAGFQPQVGYVERRVDQPQPQFQCAFALRVRHEVGHQRRRNAAMAPGHNLVVLVEAGSNVLVRHAVIERVMDVVFASPHHLHRCAAHRLGEDCRFQGKVAFRLAPEATTQQGHVDRDILFLHSKRLRDVTTRSAWALHAGPDFGFAVLDLHDGCRRFHRNMDAMRNVVLALDDLGGACQGLVDVALIALDLARACAPSPASAPCTCPSCSSCWGRHPR